jgi:hypothetical protein
MVTFIRDSARDNKIHGSTATSLVSAIRRIIESVHGEGSLAKIDVPTLDVPGILVLFERNEAGHLGANTRQSYRSRFQSAVDMFLKFLRDPASWRQISGSTHEVDGFEEYRIPIRGATGRLILPRSLTSIEADRVAAYVRALVEEVA